ncbi:hypothetical protein D0N36_10130 [Hymenobacter lapidiphilus]|uniref:hypothetical protein n=1 Tax=Hymenobacter sp. CCM 8763 TaxID=2303334 RepID=UPI000E34F074|nr:hypothetical protein [Hymenobacter sp. CCM 8763]RFP65210.1 hypothetical protein D0N36_10130 [Hymenobacter sp. CCM 8763]
MLRSFLTWFSLLIMATALAACCGSTACECDDTFADAVGLEFSADTTSANPTGFRARQVDTVYLVRVPRDTAQKPRADTVQLVRSIARFSQPVIINNTTPFAQAGNRKLDGYSYQLYLAPARRAAPTFRLTIDSVQLNTDFRAEGCCTCFENNRKLVYLNGNLTPFDQTDLTRNNGLVPLTISRKP